MLGKNIRYIGRCRCFCYSHTGGKVRISFKGQLKEWINAYLIGIQSNLYGGYIYA